MQCRRCLKMLEAGEVGHLVDGPDVPVRFSIQTSFQYQVLVCTRCKRSEEVGFKDVADGGNGLMVDGKGIYVFRDEPDWPTLTRGQVQVMELVALGQVVRAKHSIWRLDVNGNLGSDVSNAARQLLRLDLCHWVKLVKPAGVQGAPTGLLQLNTQGWRMWQHICTLGSDVKELNG